MKLKARGKATVGVCIAFALTLTPCSAEGGDQMTPHEARDAFIALVEATAERLGGGTWEVSAVPRPQRCGLAGGGTGVRYAYGMSAEPGDNPRSDAQRVADYWQGLGMDSRVALEDLPSAFGGGGASSNISFTGTSEGYAIRGSSVCVAGDAVEQSKLDSENP